MAIREGLCTNCGSLMRIDDSQESSSCIFCWATVDNQDALDLMEDSEGYEFPNETFSEPDATTKVEVMRSQGLGGVHVVSDPMRQARKVTQRKEGKLTPREKVALQNKPLVKPECSKKHRLSIVAGVVGFVVLLAGVAVPVYFSRENKKAEILARLDKVAAFAEDSARVNVLQQNNSAITLISPDELTEDVAKEVFNSYSQVYSEVYAISEEEAKNKVRVKILDEKSGGFEVYNDKNEAVINDLE